MAKLLRLQAAPNDERAAFNPHYVTQVVDMPPNQARLYLVGGSELVVNMTADQAADLIDAAIRQDGP